jgi:hypothetical protein
MAGFVKKNCKGQAGARESRALNFRLLTNEGKALILKLIQKRREYDYRFQFPGRYRIPNDLETRSCSTFFYPGLD